MTSKITEFAAKNKIHFNNEALLTLALTHPSYYDKDKQSFNNNQRLEFLGDAVLNLIIVERLFERFPRKAEGELTKIRAKIVCEKALMQVAVRINIGKYLLLGKGEEMSGGRTRKSILADAVEALIGAIYLDKGYQAAKEFVMAYFKPIMENTANGVYYDYKSRLQEIVQAKTQKSVTYAIIEESGPAHAKVFTVGVYYHDVLLAKGTGKSKKEAEQNAAEKILQDEISLLRLL